MERWWGAAERGVSVVGARFGPELYRPLSVPRDVARAIDRNLSAPERRMDAALRSDDQSLKNAAVREAIDKQDADALALLVASYGDGNREYVRADLPLSTRFAAAAVRARLTARPPPELP